MPPLPSWTAKKWDVVEDGFEFISGGDAYLFGLQMNYRF
jgi:long-chain fatty acid transport protein